MKNLLLHFLALLPIVFMLSCSDNDSPPPGPPLPTDYTVLSSSNASYLVGAQGQTTGFYKLTLSTGSQGGAKAKTTDTFDLYFHSNYTQDAENTAPATGKYVVGSDALFTFAAGQYDATQQKHINTTFTTYNNETQATVVVPIVDGTFEIAMSGTEYTITIDLIDDKGTTMLYKYVGTLNFEYLYTPPTTGVTIIKNAVGEYFGDYFEVQTGNFLFELYTNDNPEFVEPKDGDKIYALDFSSILATDNFNALPKQGEYVAGLDGAEFTFMPGAPDEEYPDDYEGSLCGTYDAASDDFIISMITSGRFFIARDGDIYDLYLELIDEFGDKHCCIYTGAIEIENEAGPNYLDKDLHTTEFAMAEAMPLPFFFPGNWYLTLCGVGTEVYGTRVTGTGASFLFDMYMDENMETIAVGEYVITDETQEEFTITAGYLGMGYSGSWYFDCVDEKVVAIAPLISGTLTISQEGDIYTAVMDMMDDKGHKITGTYNGEFALFDISGKAPPKYTPRYLDNGRKAMPIAPPQKRTKGSMFGSAKMIGR